MRCRIWSRARKHTTFWLQIKIRLCSFSKLDCICEIFSQQITPSNGIRAAPLYAGAMSEQKSEMILMDNSNLENETLRQQSADVSHKIFLENA